MFVFASCTYIVKMTLKPHFYALLLSSDVILGRPLNETFSRKEIVRPTNLDKTIFVTRQEKE